MEHRLSRDSLEKRLRYRGFPFKRLHYSTPPQEFFRRLREEEVATCEFASECRDVRYNFAPTLANICITADHFHIDPLADLFTEHVRLSSHVKGCPSPLKMWHKYVRNELPR
ncbi:hypothetical protein EBZ37_12290, partial [bacterium]|nr:hypothetical protein [bacterium]